MCWSFSSFIIIFFKIWIWRTSHSWEKIEGVPYLTPLLALQHKSWHEKYPYSSEFVDFRFSPSSLPYSRVVSICFYTSVSSSLFCFFTFSSKFRKESRLSFLDLFLYHCKFCPNLILCFWIYDLIESLPLCCLIKQKPWKKNSTLSSFQTFTLTNSSSFSLDKHTQFILAQSTYQWMSLSIKYSTI